jgi:hypothetical protein
VDDITGEPTTHARDGRCTYTGFEWENLRERENLEELDVYWRIILMNFKKII